MQLAKVVKLLSQLQSQLAKRQALLPPPKLQLLLQQMLLLLLLLPLVSA